MAVSSAAPRRSPLDAFRTDRALALFCAAATTILIVRIVALMASPIGLHPDEAQYWSWSRALDWGYFSKPPLVAWTIAATTALFGDATWGVRLAAPIMHTLAAGALFALGRRMWGDAVGLWAGVSWLLIPGVWLSSSIMSTDALLLPLWACALYTAWRWIESRDMRWALATGALVGVGMLAKYAMLYFFAGAALACLFSAAARKAILSWAGLAALAATAAIAAPNVAWNAAHDFETVAHTAANADWRGDFPNIGELGDFLVDQFALALVITGGLGVALFSFARKPPEDARLRFLLAFALPPLIIIAVQALISRAHGNWAAAAYPAAVLLVAARFAGGRFLPIANGVHAALFAVFLTLGVAPSIGDALGWKAPKNMSQMRAWDETAAAIERQVRAGGPYTAVLVDYRHTFFELQYEWRDKKDLPPLRMWVLRDAPGNHAEAESPMTADVDAKVLVAYVPDKYDTYLVGDFDQFREISRFTTALGKRERQIVLGEASGFRPVERTPEFLAKVAN